MKKLFSIQTQIFASLLITLLLVLSTTFIFAQTPTTIPGKISYQGKLLENNLPVTGSRTIEFSIPGTGWTETHTGVQVSKGLYSVQLGSITPIPVTVFNSPTVTLEIAVEGTTLSPQVELLSVPYAYKADDAKTVNGLTVETAVPAGAVFTDTQNLNSVLTQGADANNQNITNLADPVNAQDAATKAYVNSQNTMTNENGGNFCLWTSSGAHAWSHETKSWYGVSTGGSTEYGIVESDGNFCLWTSSGAHAWSHETKSWYGVSTGSSTEYGIVESDGNFCLWTSSGAHAWSHETKSWYGMSTGGGTEDELVGSDGNFGLRTSSGAYAWSHETKSWYGVSTGGSTEYGIVGSD